MVLVIKRGASKKEIAEIEQKIAEEVKPALKAFDPSQFNGSITSFGDPLTIQNELRNEWERDFH